MIYRPSLSRCFAYAFLHLTVVFLIPMWVIVFVNSEMDRFTLLALGTFTLIALLLMPALLALFMRGMLTVQLDEQSATLNSFGGLYTKRIPYTEIKVVRWFLFVNLVSRGSFSPAIVLPSLFLLDTATSENVVQYLRTQIDAAHPLTRMVR